MKLRYSPASPFARKVMVVAIECGLADRIEKVPTIVIPGKPNEELRRENPLIKVPALVTDDGTVLYDSPVICEYLDSLHDGRKLVPPAGEERWMTLRRQALADGILEAAVLVRYETAVRPEELRWEAWIDAQMDKIRGGLDRIETEHVGKPFDLGAIATACALGYLDLRFAAENWRGTRPQLAAWFEEIGNRPALRATVPHG